MIFLKKFLLVVIIICSKNIFAANFTVSSPLNDQMDEYNSAFSDNSSIDNIIFEADDTLSIDAVNSSLISVTTQYGGQGKLNFTTSSALTITEGGIGTVNNKLNEVISSNNSNITINATSLYADSLNLTTSTTDIAISGTSILNFNDINLSSSNVDLVFSNASQQVNISGDINLSSGSGEINGANSNLTFAGSGAQTIYSTLGSEYRISSLNITGSNTKNFEQNVTVSNISFSNSSDAVINLSGTNNELDLTGNITSSSASGVIARIAGSNASNVLELNGTSDQTLNVIFGTSAVSRFNEIDINNTNNINFSQDSYVNIMNINGANATLNSTALMDISTLNISEDVTLLGSSTMSIANFNVDDGHEVTLNRDISISGHINGLVGDNTEEISVISGAILFNGSSTQHVNNLTLGKVSTIRLGTLKTSNIDDTGVNFNDNVYVNDVVFENSSGDANLNIANLKEFDIGGNVTKSTGNALIKGDGTVKLSGTDTQNINVNLGTSDNRLESLNITNSAGVILSNNIYVNSFDYNGNNLTLVSNSNLDIVQDMDLGNKNINFRLSSDNSASNPFGKIAIG